MKKKASYESNHHGNTEQGLSKRKGSSRWKQPLLWERLKAIMSNGLGDRSFPGSLKVPLMLLTSDTEFTMQLKYVD